MLALLLASSLAHDPLVPLATFRSARTIAMFYEVDLAEHNSHSPAIAATLRSNDDDVRACYTKRLADVPTLRGNIVFEIHLSPTDGGIDSISRHSGTIEDEALTQCIVRNLSTMPFAPAVTMHGMVRYEFDATAAVTEATEP